MVDKSDKSNESNNIPDLINQSVKSDEVEGAGNPDQVEDILMENKNRFVLFPIKHHDIWNFYKMAQASFWTAEEIDLVKDIPQFEQLAANEKFFIKNIFRIYYLDFFIV